MKQPSMTDPADLWLRDGSLRDVYILGATDSDWTVLSECVSEYEHRYLVDGEPRALPRHQEIFGDREHSHLLEILVNGVRINCHFFVPEEIELDIDPREILTEDRHRAVLEFLKKLANRCSKRLILTPENSEETPLLSYEPERGEWERHEIGENGHAV